MWKALGQWGDGVVRAAHDKACRACGTQTLYANELTRYGEVAFVHFNIFRPQTGGRSCWNTALWFAQPDGFFT